MGGFALDQRALVRALRLFSEEDPILTARATKTLDILLAGVYASPWKEVAWAFSRLTGDGFPVEFAFSCDDEALRYTAEIAGPEQDNAERLDCAEQLLLQLGAPPLPETTRAALHNVQKGRALEFGAWIGGRHGADGDRYKLYVEVPRAGSPEDSRLVQSLLGEKPLLPGRSLQLLMIGHEPGSSRIELYFRIGRLEPWEVELLLQRAHLASRKEELLSFLEEAHGYSAQQTLPGTNLGCSFSISTPGGPPVLSLFAYARSIFGGDMRTRQRLIELGALRGWDLRSYARLSEPLALRNDWRTLHGMVSFVVPPQGSLVLHIGLRPPEPEVAL